MQESRGCGETHSRPHTLQRWNLGLGVTEVRGNATGYNSPLNLPMNNTPRHQFNLQSRLNLTTHWEFDSGLYHYNGIPT